MNLGIASKKALVTGGTKGIGAAITKAFLREGVLVCVVGRTKSAFETLKSSISMSESERLSFIPCNFELNPDVDILLNQLKLHRFDILINNAGVNKIGDLENITDEDFDRIQNINVRVPFKLSRSLMPEMAKRGWGRVVNITSVFGHVSKSLRTSYSTSKFALVGMSKALALEYASKGVLINSLGPGFIETELTTRILGDQGIRETLHQVPMRRLGQPEEVANFVLFLSSEANTFMTGQNILVDGGFSIA